LMPERGSQAKVLLCLGKSGAGAGGVGLVLAD
jgi:hypothetical protein